MKNSLLFILSVILTVNSYAQTGNVGIGTTSPTAKLTVNGGLAVIPTSLAAAATITVPTNTSTVYITNVAGVQANAVSATSPVEGQVLTIINLDDNVAIFNSTSIAPTTGVGIFQYVNAGWRTISSAAGNDWTKATTASTPAVKSDAQYVTGNIGIGDFSGASSTPAQELTIGTSTSNSDQRILIDAAANVQSGIGLNSAGVEKWVIYRPSSSNDLRFYNSTTTATDKITFQDGTGNVGIGLTSPSTRLHVQTGANSTAATFDGSNSADNTAVVSIRRQDIPARKIDFIPSAYDGSANTWQEIQFSSSSIAGTHTTRFTNGLKYTFDNIVGIGTNTPNFRLTIQPAAGNSDLIQFRNNAGVNKWHMRTQGTSDGDLGFTESGIADNRLVLEQGGNIGIGTSNPEVKLQVEGSTKVTETSFTRALVVTDYSQLSGNNGNSSWTDVNCNDGWAVTALQVYVGGYLQGPIQTICANLTGVISGGTYRSGNSTNGYDNADHIFDCNSNEIARGFGLYKSSTGEFDNGNVFCSTVSSGYTRGTAFQALGNSGNGTGPDNMNHATSCPPGSYLVGSTIYATGRLDGNLRIRCATITKN